jgi:hypothetical protein
VNPCIDHTIKMDKNRKIRCRGRLITRPFSK